MKWVAGQGLECQAQEFGFYQKNVRREGGLEQGNDALKSRSQENRLEGVKQEVGGRLEQLWGGQRGSTTVWGG